jgi:hypothetical protein
MRRLAPLAASFTFAFGLAYAQDRREIPVTAGLDAAFHAAAQGQTAWIGYAVPASGFVGWNCQSTKGISPPGPVRLEPPDQMFLLFRLESGRVVKIRLLPADCLLDAGGLPLYWLTGVRPSESVSLLETFLNESSHVSESAMAAISLHRDPSAARELIRIARNRDSEPRLRKRAVFWLAGSRDPQAWDFIEKLLRQ